MSVGGVQYAICVASTVLLLVSSHAVAEVESAPINKVPDVTLVILKLVTVPKLSVALLLLNRLSNVIAIDVSSFPEATVLMPLIYEGFPPSPPTILLGLNSVKVGAIWCIKSE